MPGNEREELRYKLRETNQEGEALFDLGHRVRTRSRSGSLLDDVAIPGNWAGLLSAELIARLHDLSFLCEILKDPPVEETPGWVRIEVDPFDRLRVWAKYHHLATARFRWRKVYPADFDLDDGPTIQDTPVQRPLGVLARSMDLPAAGFPTGPTLITIVDVIQYILGFIQATPTTAQFGISMPNGYNLGALRSRFAWYGSTGSGGTVIWEIRAQTVTPGEVPGGFPASFTVVTDGNRGVNELNVSELTPEFTPEGVERRGNPVHFNIRRNAGTYSGVAQLREVQVFYSKDRATDEVILPAVPITP